MRDTHAPRTPKQLELESQVDPILPIAKLLASSPNYFVLLPTPAGLPEEEPFLRFSTRSKFPHILAALRAQVFSMHDASQEERVSPIKPRVTPRSDGTDAPRTRWWNSSPAPLPPPASAASARC
ncbi:hypothetical protein BDA96_01G060100 [Sorghum bicolor]|uniref:Uncharacterized protein n=1 Tax=Sorghum bicolor TaxID=4558 RepID=A0A921UXQ0_SORBI|nr:hypothetical protein BDA96_01G060100 [Sorghum bicolor]